MYLDKFSIQNLFDFIGGYACALETHGLLSTKDTVFSDQFFHYLQKKYNSQGRNWKDVLLIVHNSDDIKAFWGFFDDFEKFHRDEILPMT
jgi:hypothetical protein